jgi:hypothetical protein
MEVLERYGDITIGRQVIHSIIYIHTHTHDLMLLPKEKMVLQSTIHRLNESGRCYGMENDEEKTKLMRISRQPPPVQI